METVKPMQARKNGHKIDDDPLWFIDAQEYENQCSSEAKFVKDLDQFDMILQAYEYETSLGRPRELDQFFQSTAGMYLQLYTKLSQDRSGRLRLVLRSLINAL